MQRTGIRAAAAALGLLVLGAAAVTAQAISSAHWRSTIEFQGGQREAVGPIEGEFWMKQGRMRMKNTVMGMNMNIIHAGDTTWQWNDAQKAGMKFVSAETGRRQGAGGDYANRIDEYRTKGKKLGSETLDGHPCDIYELTTAGKPGADRKERVWLASDLRHFPVKVVMESNGAKTTSHNTDIELNASVPDSMLTPPEDIQFQDMSEMMKKGLPPSKSE